MACNSCGFSHTGHDCPNQGPELIGPIGWACPVCNRGNAPDTRICGHCADPLDAVGISSNIEEWTNGKISLRRTD